MEKIGNFSPPRTQSPPNTVHVVRASGSTNTSSSLAPGQLLQGVIAEKLSDTSYLIETGGKQLTAESKLPLTPGEKLTFEVVATQPKVELKVIDQSPVNRFIAKNVSFLSRNIDIGELFRALRPGANLPQSALQSAAQLNIGNGSGNNSDGLQSGATQTAPGTMPGNSAAQLSQQPQTSILTNTVSTVQQSASSTLASQLSTDSIRFLENFFSLQRSDLSHPDAGGQIKQLLDGLGLNFEHRLQHGDQEQIPPSLKSVLTEILSKNIASGEDIKATEQARQLLGTLEIFQAAQLQLSSDNFTIFPLPFSFLEQGYLQVDSGEDGASNSKQTSEEQRFALYLSLSALGDLRIEFYRNPEGLFIRFFSENREVSDFLGSHQDELKDGLSGVDVVRLLFSEGAQSPTTELTGRLLGGSGNRILDTKV